MPVETSPDQPVFFGHYRVIRKIGAGGMGEVYLARDLTLGRHVAVKVIAAGGQDGANRRLLREAQAAAALDHPNICTVHEIRSDAGRSFIVMQYCEGETLAERLHRGTLPVDETIDVLGQVADALAFAHDAGFVHRDIKPQNVMIGPNGRVKVLDFGLAKIVTRSTGPAEDTPTETQLTAQGVPVGTAAYMAPEQIRCEAVDGRTDLFAVGVVLYQCLTGQRPFEGHSTFEVFEAVMHHDPPPPIARSPSVPIALSDLCMQLLARAPHERPQSAREVHGYLAALHHSSGGSVPKPPTPPGPDGGRGRRHLRAVLQAVAGGIGLAALMLVITWVAWWRPNPLPEPNGAARRWYDRGVQSASSGAYDYAARVNNPRIGRYRLNGTMKIVDFTNVVFTIRT